MKMTIKFLIEEIVFFIVFLLYGFIQEYDKSYFKDSVFIKF